METTAIQEYRAEVMEISDTPQEMALKLADMKAKLNLVQRFFKEIMVQNQDYGVIPGTERPTLLKPGAEKLCELYGFAPTVKQVEEEKNVETGFYRARVTIALVHRRSNIIVAEGVGEANTMEGRYRWRWVPEWKLPEGMDKNALYSETRKDKSGRTYRMYRLENQDPWTLWNTVLKMAKKRALIDATLSATRSSGIFTQDLEDLQEWADGGVVIDVQAEQSTVMETPATPPKANGEKKTNGKTGGGQSQGLNWSRFWGVVKGELKLDETQVRQLAAIYLQKKEVASLAQEFRTQEELDRFLQYVKESTSF